MKDTDYQKILEMAYIGTVYVPMSIEATEIAQTFLLGSEFREVEDCYAAANEVARKYSETQSEGDVSSFNEVISRDLKFHRCYMALLREIYGYLPKEFAANYVEREDFYNWLKHYQGRYEIKCKFKDGSTMVKYDSIAFGVMSQVKFETYVREQLVFIYSEVLTKYFSGVELQNIINTIESDFRRFLEKL